MPFKSENFSPLLPVAILDFWQQRFQDVRTDRGGVRLIAHTLDQSLPTATSRKKSWQIEL